LEVEGEMADKEFLWGIQIGVVAALIVFVVFALPWWCENLAPKPEWSGEWRCEEYEDLDCRSREWRDTMGYHREFYDCIPFDVDGIREKLDEPEQWSHGYFRKCVSRVWVERKVLE